MRLTTRLSWIGLALAAAYLVYAVVPSFHENPDLLGALFGYGVLYVGPLAVVALVLRSSHRMWQIVAGLLALVPVATYLAFAVTNVYTGGWGAAVAPIAEAAPALAYFLVVFWATVLNRTEHKATVTPTTS